MKLAAIESRSFSNFYLLENTMLKVKGRIDCIVSGGASGADTLAREWAVKFELEYEEHLPAWKQPWWSPSYCKRTAAAIRNAAIASSADAVLAFWNGDEKSGTAQAIRIAKALGKPVHVVRF